MRFVPDDPGPIFGLRRQGRGPKINQQNGSIQLRYEAIDTMESAALDPFSSNATASNIELAQADSGHAHIFANQLGPNGRPICFVFTGHHADATGSQIFLEPDDIMESINVRQLALGHAYPLFYDTLFDDLRDRCREVSNAAKNAGGNVWSADQSMTGASWYGSVAQMQPIFPKLWRRIDKFSREDDFDPTQPFNGLKEWLAEEKPERVFILSRNKFTGFDNIVETDGNTVRMTEMPDDIVVVSG